MTQVKTSVNSYILLEKTIFLNTIKYTLNLWPGLHNSIEAYNSSLDKKKYIYKKPFFKLHRYILKNKQNMCQIKS